MRKRIAHLIVLALLISALPAFAQSGAPESDLRSADDIFWTDYRLRVTGATTDEDAIGVPVYPAQGYLLMISFEEKDGAAIPADAIDQFCGDLILEWNGTDISPDEVRPTVEEMGGESQTAFSLIYYIPDGAAELGDMILSCEGLSYALSGVSVGAESAPDAGAEAAVDAMEAVLDALGEDLYRAARDYLKTGETIKKGSKGEPAKGLQALVAALGKDIKVDGNVGPKTMTALHEIEAAFRMDEADAVDLQAFDRLLMMLLIATDEDEAYDLLTDGQMGEDEFYYNAACAREAQGNYYSAMLGFEEIDYLDSAERAEACVQAWPKNGELYRNGAYGGKKTYLNVKVDGDVDYATFIKIYAENGDYVSGAFIGGSGKVTVKLPSGTYVIRQGTGYDWFGVNDTFGGDGYYSTLVYEDGSDAATLESGYEYTLTLNTGYDDPEATDVGTDSVDWGGF